MSDTLALDFAIRPLSPLFAAEIVGLDLRQPLADPVRRAVYDAFVQYHVVAFRDQRLTKEEQIAFTEQFGSLERHIARNRGSDNPWVHTVSNLGADGRPSGKVNSTSWHTDKSFRPEPSLATILHAVTMPPDGGDTCFANMYAATTRSKSTRRRRSTACASSTVGNYPARRSARSPPPQRSGTRRR